MEDGGSTEDVNDQQIAKQTNRKYRSTETSGNVVFSQVTKLMLVCS